MRLIFLCGCLEPGKDGVGDYTRRLAEACAGLGHQVQVVAVNDRYLAAELIEEPSAYTLVRLPAKVAWSQRRSRIENILVDFAPDNVCVQFVPFAFQSKGLCWPWLRFQRAVARRWRMSLVVHEIWVDWGCPVKLSSKALGILQFVLMALIRFGRGQCVTITAVPYYQSKLRLLGLRAKLLPLFSNFSRVEVGRAAALHWLSTKLGFLCGEDIFIAGFFGDILSTLDMKAFAAWLGGHAGNHKRIIILSAGGLSAYGEFIWGRLTQLATDAIFFRRLGRIDGAEGSLYFSCLRYGLSAYPEELHSKSGALAAMRQHGLPVILFGNGMGNVPPVELTCSEEIANGCSVSSVSESFLRLIS